MKTLQKIIILLVIISTELVYSQKILIEYDKNYNVNFKIYKPNENVLYKISKSESSNNTVEKLAQSYFFASDIDWDKSNYFEESDFEPKKDSNYESLKKLNNTKNYLTLLHKFSFTIEGNEFCYLMFIVNIDGIDFKFPTCITCIKKGNKWYITKLYNQNKLYEILLTFKSFRLLQLLKGEKTGSLQMDNLIANTRDLNSNLDIEKLYQLSNKWEYLGNEQKYFTNMKDNECEDVNLYEIDKLVRFTGTMYISLESYDSDDQKNLINLKKSFNIENSYVIAKLEFSLNGKSYKFVKYKDSTSKPKTINLDKTLNLNEIPISNIIYLFDNCKPQLFIDLMTTLNEEQRENTLYKMTRGNMEVLNITKLFEIYNKNKALFTSYSN